MRKVGQFTLMVFCAAFFTLAYWILYQKPLIGVDDANIYFVYVKNLVEGHGFVYYPGGERVEGFTSILWVLLITPLYFFGSHFETVVLCFNVLLISWLLWKSVLFVNHLTNQKRFLSLPALLFLAFLTVVPGYLDWTILTLMETGLWSLLVVGITLLLCDEKDKRWSFSIALAILVLTRPESLLWGVVFIGLYFVKHWITLKEIKGAIKTLVRPVSLFVLAILMLTSFRLYYFGYPLPNTYYAKVSTNLIYNLTEGIRYYLFSAIQSPLLIILTVAPAVSVIVLFIRRKSLFEGDADSRTQFTLAVVSLVSISIPIYVGGDHFKLLRFLQPFFPVYFFVLFNLSFWKRVLSVQWAEATPRIYLWAVAILLLPFLYLTTDTPLHTFLKEGSPIKGEFDLASVGRQEGEKMNTLFSTLDSLPTVGVSAAGGFAYTYKGTTLDLMGLNNVTMAHALKEKVGMKNHAAFDPVTFLRQQPDIFHGYKKISMFVNSLADTTVLENDPGFRDMHVYRLFKKVFDDPKFKATYQPVLISDKEGKYIFKTYCTLKFIEELRSHSFQVIPLKVYLNSNIPMSGAPD